MVIIMKTYEKSIELSNKAITLMPGPHSNLGSSLLAHPTFINHGEGAHLIDIDGNEYIDYVNGLGPGILGFRNREYIESITEQINKLYYLNNGDLRFPLEIELAEKIVRHVPCAEKVRFCLSGTEAIQLSIRLARAYTKRRYILRFEGHYNGWMDNVLGGIVSNDINNPFPISSENDPLKTMGRDSAAFEQSLLIPWNDIEIFERVFEKYKEEIAMVIMEPIPLNSGCCMPRSGYLERIRELCTKNGVILCFDEVQTGFRVSLNGAQGIFAVTPDISTFGKALGGGIIIGAVVGKSDIMDQLLDRRVIGAGTFNGNPLSIAAALTTLKILEKDNGAIYDKINNIQKVLIKGIKDIVDRYGLPMLIQGPTGVFNTIFTDKQVAYSVRDLKDADNNKLNKFVTKLLKEGIIIVRNGRWFISAALNENDIDRTIECVNKVLPNL